MEKEHKNLYDNVKENFSPYDNGKSRNYRRFIIINKFLFAAILIFIIYGSLYPFNFNGEYISDAALTDFLNNWRVISRPGDHLGNIALFFPFGLVGMIAILPDRTPLLRYAVLCLIGLVVAASVQILQLFLPSRDAALGDVVWNLCGLSLGAMLPWARRTDTHFLNQAGSGYHLVPLGLFAAWLMAELAPFVPSIDLQAIKDSLKPLLATWSIDPFEVYRTYTYWLMALFLASRIRPGRPAALWLFCGGVGVLLAKIIVVHNAVSPSYLVAAVAALLTWSLFLRRSTNGAAFLLAIVSVLVFVASLEPFNVRDAAAPFSWIPFSGALTGSMLINAKAVAAKIFLLGSLLWLFQICGVRPALAIVLVASFTAALEVAQIWFGEHTPEITDPLLAVFLGVTIAALRGDPAASGAQPRDRAHRPDEAATEPPRSRRSDPMTSTRRRRRRSSQSEPGHELWPTKHGLAAALIACTGATVAMYVVLSLPQIPYNVRELFGGEDAWWKLFLFSVAGLSVGVGGALAGKYTARSKHVFVALPVTTILACLATYFFLRLSVTIESIGDVTGSTNTYWFVMNRHMWGDAGVWLYETIGSREVIFAVERFVRFTTLAGQSVMWIAIVSTIYYRMTNRPQYYTYLKGKYFFRTALITLLSAAPWLVIFNLVTFDFSSTDNLNELIGGRGHVLYFLLILIPVNALFVVHAMRNFQLSEWIKTALVMAISLPLGWLFLKYGLNPAVGKYGDVFSGVDFLLGPNRKELLPEAMLMRRWFVVQMTMIGALAFSILLVPNSQAAKLTGNRGALKTRQRQTRRRRSRRYPDQPMPDRPQQPA